MFFSAVFKMCMVALTHILFIVISVRCEVFDTNEEGYINSQKDATRLPNIVVFVCDSMDGRLISGGRYDGVVDLPNLGKLSRRGATYLNAYTNNPICVPSRSALWSGMHSHITESWNNYKGLPDDFNKTWADLLHENAGYDTKILGIVSTKSGKHSQSNRVEAWTRNVNFTLRQEARPTVELTGTIATKRVNEKDWKYVDKAVQIIRDKKFEKTNNPILLYVGTNLPHPYITPSAGEDNGFSTFKTSPYWLSKVSIDKIQIPSWLPWQKMHPIDIYSTIVKNCSSEFTKQELIDIKAYFYAMCAETDAMIGEIIDALDSSGLSDSTYVLFTSDHGELAMEHRQFYKMSMYEGSSHVPLVIGYPTKSIDKTIEDNKMLINTSARGMHFRHPVSLVDIYPTLMDIAGLRKSQYLNDTSLLPEKFDSHPGWILSQYHGCNVNASTYMLRINSLKYITFDNGPEFIPPMLFNLSSDPDELHNLAFTSKGSLLVDSLDKFLLQQVDYRQVTSKVKDYNKRSFQTWRDSLGKNYSKTISNLRWWKDWNKSPQENFQAIDNWLNF